MPLTPMCLPRRPTTQISTGRWKWFSTGPHIFLPMRVTCNNKTIKSTTGGSSALKWSHNVWIQYLQFCFYSMAKQMRNVSVWVRPLLTQKNWNNSQTELLFIHPSIYIIILNFNLIDHFCLFMSFNTIMGSSNSTR